MNKVIDKDKPLPSNTIYKYEECFAKLLLESVCPNDFYDLKLLDKPDLQNKKLNIGIEVTTAIESSDLELGSLYSALEYENAKDKVKVNQRIKDLGGRISNGILSHPSYSRNLSNIDNCIYTKLKKINGNSYKQFDNNYLFISDQNLILRQECSSLLKRYQDIQLQYKIKFQKIYIYRLGGELFEFDINNNVYNIFEVKNVYDISINSRKMVEDKEKRLI